MCSPGAEPSNYINANGSCDMAVSGAKFKFGTRVCGLTQASGPVCRPCPRWIWETGSCYAVNEMYHGAGLVETVAELERSRMNVPLRWYSGPVTEPVHSYPFRQPVMATAVDRRRVSCKASDQ